MASSDEGLLVSPTSIPPETMIISKPTAANAFLERMARIESGRRDEGLSERSDKSIYDENVVFDTL